MSSEPPRDRVIAERRRRGWSARTAAQAATISNTTWSEFERGGELTGTVRQAVADAFGWPMTWPDELVVSEPAGLQALLEKIQDGINAGEEDRRSILDKLDVVLDELRQHRRQVEPTEGVDDVLERLAAAVEAVTGQRSARGQQSAG